MYLKLEINGEESLHPFDGMKSVNIGKSDKCDLVINSQTISRHHAKVISKGGEYYYVDMGSKEGSYLNDEKLKPKAGTPFNTFFPIRLGPDIFLYLLDEEIPVEDEQESEIIAETTKPEKKFNNNFYIPESAGTVTEDASKILSKEAPTERVDRKRKRNSKRPVKTQKKVDRNQQILIFLLFVIVGSFFYFKHYTAQQDEILKQKIANQQLEAAKQAKLLQQKALEKKEAEKLLAVKKIDQAQNSLGTYVLSDKCLIQIEKDLCESFKSFKSRNYKEGYAKSIDVLSLTINQDASYKFIKTKAKPYTKEEIPMVLEFAKKQMGPRYHRGYFINKLKMKLQKYSEIDNLGKYMILLDFLMSGGPEALTIVAGLEKVNTFYIIGVVDNKVESYIKTTVEKAKALAKVDANFAIKLLLDSGITSKLDEIIKSLETQ